MKATTIPAAASATTLPRRSLLWSLAALAPLLLLAPSAARAGETERPWADLVDEVAAWPSDALISHEFFAGATTEQARAALAIEQVALGGIDRDRHRVADGGAELLGGPHRDQRARHADGDHRGLAQDLEGVGGRLDLRAVAVAVAAERGRVLRPEAQRDGPAAAGQPPRSARPPPRTPRP